MLMQGSISPILKKLDLASASVTVDEEKHVLGSGATILTTPLATVSNTRSGNILTQMYRFLILLAAVGFKEVPDGAVCSVAEQGIIERADREGIQSNIKEYNVNVKLRAGIQSNNQTINWCSYDTNCTQADFRSPFDVRAQAMKRHMPQPHHRVAQSNRI